MSDESVNKTSTQYKGKKINFSFLNLVAGLWRGSLCILFTYNSHSIVNSKTQSAGQETCPIYVSKGDRSLMGESLASPFVLFFYIFIIQLKKSSPVDKYRNSGHSMLICGS